MSVLDHHTVLPPAGEDADRDDLNALKLILAGESPIRVSSEDGFVDLPGSMRELLRDAVGSLVAGQAVSLEPRRTILTTQEAADLLGITRPTFVRLLEEGRIPFTVPGRHRRVELADVLKFQQAERERRRAVLEDMGRESSPDTGSVDGFVETR